MNSNFLVLAQIMKGIQAPGSNILNMAKQLKHSLNWCPLRSGKNRNAMLDDLTRLGANKQNPIVLRSFPEKTVHF